MSIMRKNDTRANASASKGLVDMAVQFRVQIALINLLANAVAALEGGKGKVRSLVSQVVGEVNEKATGYAVAISVIEEESREDAQKGVSDGATEVRRLLGEWVPGGCDSTEEHITVGHLAASLADATASASHIATQHAVGKDYDALAGRYRKLEKALSEVFGRLYSTTIDLELGMSYVKEKVRGAK